MSLTPEIDAFVAAQIASGHFNNPGEVVRAAPRLLDEQELRRERALAR